MVAVVLVVLGLALVGHVSNNRFKERCVRAGGVPVKVVGEGRACISGMTRIQVEGERP